jgi:hypothetical protein
MARADRNSLHRSAIDTARQQRREEPKVAGATGTLEDVSPKAAEVKARKRRGKNEEAHSGGHPGLTTGAVRSSA